MSRSETIDLSKRARLPQVFPIRQFFKRPRVADVRAAVCAEMARLFGTGEELDKIRGKKIGVTASSRGLANQPELLRTIVAELRARGAEVSIIPAIGSHGGGTAAGELARLAELGVTSESAGAPILSGLTTSRIDSIGGVDIYCSDHVLNSVDGIFLFGRVRRHTDIAWNDGEDAATRFAADPSEAGQRGLFWGLESGLSKMLAVGLAKHQARALHFAEIGLGKAIEIAARRLLLEPRVNVVGGISVVDNAYDETAFVRACPFQSPDQFFRDQRSILDESNELLPSLPWPEGTYDLLYVHRAGKNIIGQGVDTKIIGRSFDTYVRGTAWRPGMPAIYTIGCGTLDGGNAMGRGKFELVTERYAAAMDEKVTSANANATGYLAAVDMPAVVPTDRDLLEIGLGNSPVGPLGARVALIVSTLWLENVWLSAAFFSAAQELERQERIRIEGELRDLPFTSDGFVDLPELAAF